MLILFRNADDNTLAVVLADYLAYDADEGKLWFSSGSDVWETLMPAVDAEYMMKYAYERQKINLSTRLCDYIGPYQEDCA